jgi:prolyl oligopeptidase
MKKIIISLIAFLGYSTLFAQWQYPASKKVEVSDTYFGVTYKDNYRWLEDMKNPEVESWFKAQANLTNATMNTISERATTTDTLRNIEK